MNITIFVWGTNFGYTREAKCKKLLRCEPFQSQDFVLEVQNNIACLEMMATKTFFENQNLGITRKLSTREVSGREWNLKVLTFSETEINFHQVPSHQ